MSMPFGKVFKPYGRLLDMPTAAYELGVKARKDGAESFVTVRHYLAEGLIRTGEEVDGFYEGYSGRGHLGFDSWEGRIRPSSSSRAFELGRSVARRGAWFHASLDHYRSEGLITCLTEILDYYKGYYGPDFDVYQADGEIVARNKK